MPIIRQRRDNKCARMMISFVFFCCLNIIGMGILHRVHMNKDYKYCPCKDLGYNILYNHHNIHECNFRLPQDVITYNIRMKCCINPGYFMCY